MATKPRAVDLGALQQEAETASKNLKAANAELRRAKLKQEAAEVSYHNATKSLNQAVDVVKSQVAVQ
jgi:hypothetical protein